MKKSAIIILFILGVIVVLSLAQTILSNTLSTSGVLVDEINKEIQVYKTQNAEIREQVFLKASLNTIADKAEKLGFKEDKSYLVLTKSDLVLTTSSSLAVRQ